MPAGDFKYFERVWRSPSYRDRGAFSNIQMEGNVRPVVSEGPELPMASSDNLALPTSRSEILELRIRLADIEARRISLPPSAQG